MKIFTIILGARFSVLMSLIFRNGISFRPVYLIRFLILLFNSLITSSLILVEKMNYGRKTRETEIAIPPIFIIGHWRTGSTLLHQLINLDPRLTAPTMVQTVIPEHVLFSTKYYAPILKRALPESRPMDMVALSPFEPQEEEFALIRMGSVSPIEKLIFPSGKCYFLKDYDQYVPTGKRLKLWKKNLITFYKKITLETGKQIVSKNPYHTMRMELLAEMFPGAKFIHITRDPLVVVPSTIRMWNKVAVENDMKRGWNEPSVSDTVSVLRDFRNYVITARHKLNSPVSDIQFEDLENDPIGELKRIYSELDLFWSDEFERAVLQFLEANRNYRKGNYELSREDEELIRTMMLNY
jgi:hypothetical protein